MSIKDLRDFVEGLKQINYVDPTNMNEVIHAFSVKCNPSRGIRIDKWASNCPLTPYLPVGMKEKGMGGGNVLFDCTWPKEWKQEDIPIKCSFNDCPEEIKEKVRSRWQEDYGFKCLSFKWILLLIAISLGIIIRVITTYIQRR
ncbi:MAG: hypothetical protein SV062_05255 [Thermodesulfobacteriota bacterium]|nr:hypothetical protein [Thermodesulfobacteriota bacterium]